MKSGSKYAQKYEGTSKEMNCGVVATILKYRNYRDIDVKFDNGEIARHRTVTNFNNGEIESKKEIELQKTVKEKTRPKRKSPEEYVKSLIEGNTYYTAEGEEIKITKALSTTEIYAKVWKKEFKCTLYDLQVGRTHSVKFVVDHKGIKYVNNKEKAAAYGLEYKTYMFRIRNGWGEKEALETPARVFNKEDIKDHLGNTYESQEERAKVYGLGVSCIKGRLEIGWSLEEALTTPSQRVEEVKDHEGNVFNSFTEMCNHWGITDITFVKRRLAKGWTLKDALTVPSEKSNIEVEVDGVEYSSKVKACNVLNVSRATVKKYENQGYSFEEAVHIAKSVKIDNSVVVLGKKWDNCTELADYYKVDRRSLSDRINLKGQDPEEALQEALNNKYTKSEFSGWNIIKMVYFDEETSYYLCAKGTLEEVLSLKELKRNVI